MDASMGVSSGAMTSDFRERIRPHGLHPVNRQAHVEKVLVK